MMSQIVRIDTKYLTNLTVYAGQKQDLAIARHLCCLQNMCCYKEHFPYVDKELKRLLGVWRPIPQQMFARHPI